MTILQAVVLGVIQGLTEFIPISSTAHLRLVPALLGWEDPGAAASAVIQLGTLLAVMIYFFRDIGNMTIGLTRGLVSGRPFGNPDARLAWLIVIGTIPIGALGLAFQDFIETTARNLWLVAVSLVLMALLLLAAEAFAARIEDRRDVQDLGIADGLIVGLGQCLALIPGMSRSGSTIMAALFRRMGHAPAARFSFLLGIPAIAVSGVFELVAERDHLASLGWGAIVVAIGVSFVTGWASIWFLLRYLRRHTTHLFIAYRVVLGLAMMALILSGAVSAA